jgi:nicotinamide-nucleotide amidase
LRAEILCVGSELLLGQIIDTNAAFIASQLSRIGVDLHRKQTAGDNLERIADCIRGALSRADCLVITGGLGPTNDDLTREAIALALGVPLVHQQNLEDELREWFASRDIEIISTILRQAYLPEGALAIPNSNGTAPGVFATRDGKMVFAVPGVPREMRAMLELSVVPAILEQMEGERQIIVSRVLRTFGIGESMLAEPLEDILTIATNPTVAPLIYGKTTEVHLRLTAKAPDEESARVLLDEMESRIRARAGKHIFGVDDETLAFVVVRELTRRNLKLAVAESLTGGLLGEMITEVPGASAVFSGGAITYSDGAKARVLAVPAATLAQHSAVSEETARVMAEGTLSLFHTDFALSTTGEAGPESGSGAPVGTVFCGLAISGTGDVSTRTQVESRRFTGDREAIRTRTAMCALDLLRRHLQESSGAREPEA